MKKQKLTQREKEERDFKQFSLLTLRMIAQSYKNPRQLRRLKSWQQFLTESINDIKKNKK